MTLRLSTEKDQRNMEEQLERSKRRLHFCMAVMGGWFGAYAILRFHHFASAATVNFIEVFTSAVQGDRLKALLRLGIVALYVFAIFLAACLTKLYKGDLRRWAILADGAAACALTVLPDRLSELGVCICIFAMGFQWCVFAGKYGYPCSTIFSTNNLRQFVDAWVQTRLFHDTDHTTRMNLYGGTLLAFHTGVIAECALWALGWGSRTILPILLPAALALVWQQRDFQMRKRIEEAFEPHHTV